MMVNNFLLAILHNYNNIRNYDCINKSQKGSWLKVRYHVPRAQSANLTLINLQVDSEYVVA